MITILQTGDLHLGKVFFEYSLIEDQACMLNSLLEELKKNHYDALVISGDIYDRGVPPPEAIRLFDDFLNRLHSLFPEVPVCIISGNHDSCTRLGFGAEFLRNENIHICTEAGNCTKPVLLKNGEGIVEAALYQLPFLQSGSLTDSDGRILRTQQDLVTEAVQRIRGAHSLLQKSGKEYKDVPAVLSCHVFTTGAKSGGSERMFIGSAELIDTSIFDFFAYTAAGHIHKTQRVSDKLYYAGSPLAYSFDEAGKEKNFLRVEFDAKAEKKEKKLTITALPIKPLRRVVKIEGNFDELFCSDKYSEYANDYVECTYTDPFIAENAAARLREKFPFLLSVKQQAFGAAQSGQKANAEKKKQMFEKENSLPVKDILYSFLADAGLLNTGSTDNLCSEDKNWEEAVELFVQGFNKHETA